MGARFKGKVVSVTDYGAFVELEKGVEGLIHVSEMSWSKRAVHPSKVVNQGDLVEVQVLGVDETNRRISLGLKQTEPNPWEELAEKHPVGSHGQGQGQVNHRLRRVRRNRAGNRRPGAYLGPLVDQEGAPSLGGI